MAGGTATRLPPSLAAALPRPAATARQKSWQPRPRRWMTISMAATARGRRRERAAAATRRARAAKEGGSRSARGGGRGG